MAGRLGILMLLGLVAAVGAVGLVVLVLVTVRGAPPAPSEAGRAAVRHAGVVHVLALTGLVAALVVGPAVVASLPLDPAQGRALGLVPALAGIAFGCVHAVGELTWPRPTGTVRRAPLSRRTAGDVAPAWLRRLTWLWAGLGAVVLLACGVVATDDGRAVSRTFEAGGTTSGPFPGWYFGVPLLVALLVVALAGEVVLRLVAARPVVSGAGPDWDLALRRLSAHRVLRGVQLVLAWTVAGVLAVAGAALRNVSEVTLDGLAAVAPAYATAGLVALLLGAAVGLAGLAAALVPGAAARAAADAVELRTAPA